VLTNHVNIVVKKDCLEAEQCNPVLLNVPATYCSFVARLANRCHRYSPLCFWHVMAVPQLSSLLAPGWPVHVRIPLL
jgi:hypothetical protein